MKKLVVLLALALVTSVKAQMASSVDTNESIITWTGSNLFKFNKHSGTVKISKGSIEMAGLEIKGGEFVIDMNSIVNTDGKYNEMLVNHLKGDDFFSVETYPNANLSIIKAIRQIDGTYDVFADLTIKNIKNPIRFTAAVTPKGRTFELTTKFIIDRTLWNVLYNTKGMFSKFKEDAISDAIEFDVNVTFIYNRKKGGC